MLIGWIGELLVFCGHLVFGLHLHRRWILSISSPRCLILSCCIIFYENTWISRYLLHEIPGVNLLFIKNELLVLHYLARFHFEWQEGEPCPSLLQVMLRSLYSHLWFIRYESYPCINLKWQICSDVIFDSPQTSSHRNIFVICCWYWVWIIIMTV